MTALAKFVATVAYVGYAPIAPGTAGSAVAATLYWFLPETKAVGGTIIVVLLIVLGIWASSRAEDVYGRDASKIVIDEFAGYFLAVLLLPKTWLILLLGFFLFRFFDIFKPYPIHLGEKLKGGFGVMADDLMAGIATNILLQIGLLIFNSMSTG